MSQILIYIVNISIIIFVAFFLTVIYPHIQTVTNEGIYIWKPQWRKLWGAIVKETKKYPTATIIPFLFILAACIGLWFTSGIGDSEKLDYMNERLDSIEVRLDYQTEVLERMEQILLDIQEALSERNE